LPNINGLRADFSTSKSTLEKKVMQKEVIQILTLASLAILTLRALREILFSVSRRVP